MAREATPFGTQPGHANQDSPSIPRKEQKISAKDIDETAKQLAAAQVQASATAKEASTSQAVLQNTTAANRHMLSAFNEKRSLSATDVESWNGIINKGLLGAKKGPTAGVYRGTRKHVTSGNNSYDVDLTKAQAHGQLSNGFVLYHHVPAGEVPSRMTVLLGRVNSLGRHSTLREIAAIYQEFELIHPFLEGNGRTGRVLLDYCLLKAGLPPLPHSSFDTRDVFFMSVEEVEQILNRAYRLQPGRQM